MNEQLYHLLDSAYELRIHDADDGIYVLVEDAKERITATFALRYDDLTLDRVLDAWFRGALAETVVPHVENVRYDDDVEEILPKLHDENIIVHIFPSEYTVMYENIRTSRGHAFLQFPYRLHRARLTRLLREMTQEEVAERIGVSASFVRDVETGRIQPDSEYIQKLADLFGVSPNVLR